MSDDLKKGVTYNYDPTTKSLIPEKHTSPGLTTRQRKAARKASKSPLYQPPERVG